MKRKGTAWNCQAPNWNGEEQKSFVMQCEGKAMISLEKLWNSNDKFREALEQHGLELSRYDLEQ